MRCVLLKNHGLIKTVTNDHNKVVCCLMLLVVSFIFYCFA
nr:MAG TPA: hypothetical protein [Caudoviricetes sp.]